ncbi:Hypothetical predicted protein [Paramuricea clavata]|uniref:Uncharacterized protein n=1 Tax=Paramuricea clavata TaxID=317549 RepID=A0A6S7GBI0_PARCT|nr:Hypothetical predicted protein [Paramuricea clavata]
MGIEKSERRARDALYWPLMSKQIAEMVSNCSRISSIRRKLGIQACGPVSLLNPQANGLAERTVQTIKDLLVKSKKDQRDSYLNMLEYRNAPIDDVGSPAQLLMNRRLRSGIPQTISHLKPRVPDSVKVKKKLNLNQHKQKFYYDRQSKSLTKLHEGDRIRVRMKGSWKPGVVTREEQTPRSYRIRLMMVVVHIGETEECF